MRRTEFERTTPESVGITSSSVQRLLDRLENGANEMHSIQIMRCGKICAEGWWSPYAPGIRHNLMSITKTYAATAIGIAYTEKLLRLSDRIIDIFPEQSPAEPDELLKRLTIRDMLCMGSSMESIPSPSLDWIRDFISTPIKHNPGTHFKYNSLGSTLLAAIIKKLTGLGLHEYLRPRLFDKIGIDSSNLRWALMPDGIEVGGAGLYATTEDNLRLIKLYADGGVFEGERILSDTYVKYATTKQIDTSSEAVMYPFAKDNFCGYGFQIWMCQPEGVYRADGAMGQYAIVCPNKDTIISITETGRGIDGPQKTLDAIWTFLDELKHIGSLPEDITASYRLQKRMASLSLPRPAYRAWSPKAEVINGKNFYIMHGMLCFENHTLSVFCGSKDSVGITQFCFHFSSDICVMEFEQDGIKYMVNIAADGSRALNNLPLENVASHAYFSGAWTSDNIFTVVARWIETSFEKEVSFCFNDIVCNITIRDPLMSFGPLGELTESYAEAATADREPSV
jgi:CubicO group peptidase (beta-lactamase class C family)